MFTAAKALFIGIFAAAAGLATLVVSFFLQLLAIPLTLAAMVYPALKQRERVKAYQKEQTQRLKQLNAIQAKYDKLYAYRDKLIRNGLNSSKVESLVRIKAQKMGLPY